MHIIHIYICIYTVCKYPYLVYGNTFIYLYTHSILYVVNICRLPRISHKSSSRGDTRIPITC